MIGVWKMHFLPTVELLARFPFVDCTESPSPGTSQLFRFLPLSDLWASSACAEQPGELDWNCEFWSTAQRADLPSKCRKHLLLSAWEKASCAGGREPQIISSSSQCGSDAKWNLIRELDCVSSTAAQNPRYSSPLFVHLEEVEQFGGWKGHFLEKKLS